MSFAYMLAPIEDMTSNAFRTICHKYGADLTFTVLTKVEGLAKKNAATWSRLDFKDDTPTVIQLIGAKEDYFKKFLDAFEPSKGFQGFNLNLGCPSPDAINIGQGCAMIKRVTKTKELVKLIKSRGYKVSIKLRLGLNKFERARKAYLNLIRAVDADFFIVHARDGTQTYADPADFSIYEECVKTGKNIIANGDIKTPKQIEFLKNIGVKGAMIGRAAVSYPGIFNKLKGLPAPPVDKLLKEYLELASRYDEPFKYRKNILKWIAIKPDVKQNLRGFRKLRQQG